MSALELAGFDREYPNDETRDRRYIEAYLFALEAFTRGYAARGRGLRRHCPALRNTCAPRPFASGVRPGAHNSLVRADDRGGVHKAAGGH